MKRRTVSCLLSAAAVLVYVSMAVATPLPLPRTIGSPTGTVVSCTTLPTLSGCGESDLASPHGAAAGAPEPRTTQLNVDWMVLAPHTYDITALGWLNVRGELPEIPLSATTVGTAGGGVCATGDCYIYLYQEENTNPNIPFGPVGGPVPDGFKMQTLTVTVPSAKVVIAGVLGANTGDAYVANPGDDLDCGPGNPAFSIVGGVYTGTCVSHASATGVALHPGHFLPSVPADPPPHFMSTATDPEEEGVCPAFDIFGTDGVNGVGDPGSFCLNPADPITVDASGGGVTWTYTPNKPPFHETVTLFFASLSPPVYGFADSKASSVPPSPWATGISDPDVLGFLGEPVPVPGILQTTDIPEPTTLVLFGGGLVALGLLRRKMKR